MSRQPSRQRIFHRALAASVLAAFAVAALSTTVSLAQEQASLVQRGEYLTHAGDCVACHTAEGGGQPFAGGGKLPTPFGTFYTPNITPDRETGIGAWSDDDFYNALHEGIGKSGEYLYPAFPFPWYTNVTREDALAIKAYLFSLAPVHSPRKPNRLNFPYNIRAALLAWRTPFFKAATSSPPSTGDAKLDRGSYLVNGLGHCGECHNHDATFGASKWSGVLQGGPIEGWYAPNLTSDPKQGIGNWSEDELATYLKTGTAPNAGVALGPMRETINDSLRYLKDEDLHAIAAYLKSLPPVETHGNQSPAIYKAPDAPGAGTYLSYCASCHLPSGEGLTDAVPALQGNGAVVAGGPQNIIRVVVGGRPATGSYAPMPAVGAGMTDQQIADVADYVRNSWGNAVPTATGTGSVAQLRASTDTLMAGNKPEDCSLSPDSPIAHMFDASSAAELKDPDQAKLLPVIAALVTKAKSVTPAMPNDTIINDLTKAYCASVTPMTPDQRQRALLIGNFAVLAYSELSGSPRP